MHALDVRARGDAELTPAGGVGHERPQRLSQSLRRGGDDRDARPEGFLGAAYRLVVQEGDDRLPERHRFDREQPVPARVQLVDDDVRGAVALERLVVVEAFDELQIGVEPFHRGDHVLASLPPARRRRVDDQRTLAFGRRCRLDRGQVDPGRDHLGLRYPADRVVAADDLGVRLLPECELRGRLAADVRAEVVHDRLLPRCTQDRELERLRHERQPEMEVEHVGAREQPGERGPLPRLPT